jgi:CheY-like chemotaxis protein
MAIRALLPLPGRERVRPGAAGAGACGADAAGSRELPLVVLVVDDERIVLAVEREALLLQGCTVLTAADANGALDAAATWRGVIDVLVTDLTLPGVQGPELAERLRRERPGTGIVFTSGLEIDAALCDRFVGSVLLRKPFTLGELADAVERAALAAPPAAA